MKNKFLKIFKFTFCLILFFNFNFLKANAEVKPPKINAKSAILMDADTGDILYSKKGEEKYFPASTTKVLTALVVLDKVNLTDKVTVGKNPPFADGSSIGLREGEVFTVENLLTGLLLESGNDCALALAEYVAGSEKDFSKLMNEKAKSIGAVNSNFENASGLPNPKHKTTAHDLALILKEGIKYPDFIRISRLISVELPPSTIDNFNLWVNNHNYLINPNSKYYYKYALAGKSGYTQISKHTFVISAKKNGKTLIGAFLNAEDKIKNYKDMKSLLEYGFNNFTNIKVLKKGDIIETKKLSNNKSLDLISNEEVSVSIPKSIEKNYKTNFEYTLPPNYKNNEFKKGQKLTTANLLIDGKEFAQFDLISGNNIERSGLNSIKDFFKSNSKIIALISTIIIVLIIVINILITIIKRRNYNKKWKHIINRDK